jgi:hypothetical protein
VPLLALDFFHESFECLVASKNAVLGQFAKRHLLGVVANFLHLVVHHLHVEDQSY